MNQKPSFPNVTISPKTGRGDGIVYDISVDTFDMPTSVTTGRYLTREAVFGAFSPPLIWAYQNAVEEALEKLEDITFSLEKAHVSL